MKKVRWPVAVALIVDATALCSVRIVDNGTEMLPRISGAAFAFDSAEGNSCDCLAESHSVERVLRVTAGTHKIAVQARRTQAESAFFLSYWLLRVDAAT